MSLAVPLLLAALGATAVGAQTNVAGARIAWSGEVPPSVSGYIPSWIPFQAVAGDERYELLLPYMRVGQAVPPPGTVCDISFVVRDGSGSVGNEHAPFKGKNVVTAMRCIGTNSHLADG